MKFKQAKKEIFYCRILYILLLFIFLLFICLSISKSIITLLTAISLVILFPIISIYLYLYYRRFRYAIIGDYLMIVSGVIYISQRQLSLATVRSIRVLYGPLERRWNIATLIFAAAGITVIVDGIARNDAEALIQHLQCR